jgi:aspartyl/glutamyl-tRNA(Asn/Gln) amidotransferase C subunit
MIPMDVARVARIARLELSPAEQEEFSRQFDEILAWASELEKLPPAADEKAGRGELRSDSASESRDPIEWRGRALRAERTL